MLPTFQTARLTVSPRTTRDTDACLAMDSDPAVVRFVSGPWSDPVAHRAFIERRTAGPYPDGLGYWSIRRRDQPDFLGWVLLIPADGFRPEIEIGWRLRRSEWGQGIATEAAQPLLRHGFETLLLRHIIAEIDPGNLASQRVAEKLGLTSVAEVLHEGRPALRYCIDRPARPGVDRPAGSDRTMQLD